VTTILIVDDSAITRAQVSGTLTGAGFSVLEAKDGLEALQVVKNVPGIALVIVDLNMPRMTGFEFLGAMRTSGGPPIPTVMITTESRTAIVEKAKRAGAKGWLVKPFKPEHLIAVARRLTTPGGPITGTMEVVSSETQRKTASTSSK
jgi:two-component system chemotaxis response regulator CheY